MNKKIKRIGLITIVLAMAMIVIGCQATEPEKHMDKDEAVQPKEMVEKDDEMTSEDMMDKDDEMMSEDMMVKDDEMMSEDMMDKDDEMMSEDVMDKDHEIMEDKMMNEGPMAPEFSLMDLDGNTVVLSDFKGEKVYVKFWASWCPICLSGLEEIDVLAGQMNDFKVITIVAPGYNGEQMEEEFKEWFKTRETENMIVLLDDKGTITKEYGVRGYPTSVFIGSDGVLVQQFPGHVDGERITEFFKDVK